MDALRWLERDGIVTLDALIAKIVRGPVRGSWWAHPKGGEIFRVASALEDSPDVLATRLVGGKTTFVHRKLWPALLRVVTDRGYRARASAALDPAGKRLLRAVERSRAPVRLDEISARLGLATKEQKQARLEIERALLCRSASVHTESGRHAIVLESWRRWAPAALLSQAARLAFDEALSRLREASPGAKLHWTFGQLA
jgi:hypothetical protein